MIMTMVTQANALYNVMPDIISRLCDPDADLDEANFQTILKWIMALIQKEKQSESLVEKIILRLGASRTERQSRDLSYCLSLLTFNERSLRRILEHWNCVSDKLHEPAVGDTLNSILNNAKKLAKPVLEFYWIQPYWTQYDAKHNRLKLSAMVPLKLSYWNLIQCNSFY